MRGLLACLLAASCADARMQAGAMNDAPRLVADAYTTPEDTVLTVAAPGVLANDGEIDAEDVFDAMVVVAPKHGALALLPNGSFVYTPSRDFTGTDQYTYRARDERGELSAATTVSLTVTAMNDEPHASDSVVRAAGATVPVTLVATDPDGDALAYEILTYPSGGTLTGTDAHRVFTPTQGVFGVHSLTFRVSDGSTISNTATVMIEVWCGNSSIDAGEQCDDGNANSDLARDSCRTNCQWAHCGDGIIDVGEDCDDGAANSDSVPNACRTTCRIATCGDGVVDDNEHCDDGGQNSNSVANACRSDCTVPRCGDRVIDAGEECDPGPQAALFDANACTSCPVATGATSTTSSCSTAGALLSEQLALPSAGEDRALLSELAAGDGSRTAPDNLAWSINAASVTRALELVTTKHGREVRWGYLTTQQIEATMQTEAGTTLTETWTLGWVHRAGDERWTSVGASSSRVRMLLDRAAQQVTTMPTLATSSIPRFSYEKLWTACEGIRTDTSTGLALLRPLLHPHLLLQVFQVNGSGSMLNNGFVTPDFDWSDVRPVAVAVEGAIAWTTVEGTYSLNNGLTFDERWILKWVYDTNVKAWSIWGFASSVERERLGELSFWWNKNRSADDFGKDGLFGRSALIRVLATNNTETGITYADSDPQTERAARRFVEDALRRFGRDSLPADRNEAVELLRDHVIASFVEGVWEYVELNKLTFLRLASVKRGHCELYIFFAGLLEWLGIRARYVGNADSPSRIEIWRGDEFRVGAFDTGNTSWIWYPYSSYERMAVIASPLPNIVTFPTDPHGFSVGRVLWWHPLLTPLFTGRDGLRCFDPATFQFDQIAYEPIP